MNQRLHDDQSGASLAEYALILALVAVGCFAAIQNTGQSVRGKLNLDFAAAVYGTSSPGPIASSGGTPTTSSGSTAVGSEGDSQSGSDDPGTKKGKKDKQVHPHGGGPGHDHGKGNDDK